MSIINYFSTYTQRARERHNINNHLFLYFSLDSPGGGGGGLVGVPVLGGKAGGTSDWLSSLNMFLLCVLEAKWSAPLD